MVATVSDIDVNELFPLNDEVEKEGSHSAYCSNINITAKNETDISFDLSKSDLTVEQKETLTHFLEQNKDLFSPSLQNLEKTDLYKHVIETEPGKGPVRLPFYRQPPHIRAEIDRQVNEILEQGIVEPSNSIWHSPVVLVKKKDGSYRFAVDYRQLNKMTQPIAHPLPRLKSALMLLVLQMHNFSQVLNLHLLIGKYLWTPPLNSNLPSSPMMAFMNSIKWPLGSKMRQCHSNFLLAP